MKKISILALHLGYGGVEKSIVSLANILCNKYEVEIATCYQLYDNCVFDLDKKVKIKYLNNKKIVPNKDKIKEAVSKKNIIRIIKEGLFAIKVLYRRKKGMVDYLKTCSSDIIISSRDFLNVWSSKYANSNIYKIGWEHNHFHNDYKYAKKIINSVKDLNAFVLVSKSLNKYYKEELKKINSKCKCFYIPNCIDALPEKVSPLKEKRLISIGRLSPEKGYLDLLMVMKKVLRDYPDWHLDIVGDGVEREKIETFIALHDIMDNVTLHGYQGKDYIDDLLSKSSIYLMTSFTESFGIVLIEAMSHGVPCIAYDSAEGAQEIINNKENGFLVKNRSYDHMVEKIELLIKDKTQRIKMGKTARESVKKYTSAVVGEEWFSLIKEGEGNE